MNPGIYYLYEYKNNHRMRNTGFLKLTQKTDFWLLQIQSRNIPVTQQHRIPLFTILTRQDRTVSKNLSELPCNHHALSAQLTIPNTNQPAIPSMQDLRGFLIQLPDGNWLAATEAHFHLNINEILEATAQSDSGKILENSIQIPENEHDTPPELSETKSDTPSELSKAESDTPSESPKEDSDVPTELSASEYKGITETSMSPEPIDAPPQARTIRKIHRSDLKILPRKCWNLANNSFLLHGYHNYHHLLLIEENEHYQLGVPGVYDIREARAAEIFGFPKFIDSYNDQMDLSAAECNTQEKFGYWCHYIY